MLRKEKGNPKELLDVQLSYFIRGGTWDVKSDKLSPVNIKGGG